MTYIFTLISGIIIGSVTAHQRALRIVKALQKKLPLNDVFSRAKYNFCQLIIDRLSVKKSSYDKEDSFWKDGFGLLSIVIFTLVVWGLLEVTA